MAILILIIFLVIKHLLAQRVGNIALEKGYDYTGFYLFGFFEFLIALIVVLCLNDKNEDKKYGFSNVKLDTDSWKCRKCGRINKNYVGTCACGSKMQKNKLIAERQYKEISNADELKKYKDLLDSGVITQEEFDLKKKQLLGL